MKKLKQVATAVVATTRIAAAARINAL